MVRKLTYRKGASMSNEVVPRWIKIVCRHCGADGELPVRDGIPLKRLCWNCDDALWRAGTDWRRL